MKTIVLVLVGALQGFSVTAYRSVPNQTDSSPFHTSTSEHVSPYGVAVSQDLICLACRRLHRRCKELEGERLHYGDLLYIEEIGWKFVNDLMNERHKNSVDIWVKTREEEKIFYRRFKDKKLSIWRILNDS